MLMICIETAKNVYKGSTLIKLQSFLFIEYFILIYWVGVECPPG